MKSKGEIPLLFYGQNEAGSYFLPIFEYKKNVHALLGKG